VKRFSFNSSITLGPHLPSFAEEQTKNEPMLFSCDWETAERLGGPLTNAFLKALWPLWERDGVIIDSRVHMLMPGWYPCIPGWHHDDVPRTRSDGQPNYDAPDYQAEHVCALVNGDVCPTAFAIGKHSLPDIPLGSVFYREWHPLVDQAVEHGDLSLVHAPTNRLVFFDWQTMHQGTQARTNGWRWFIRASRNTARRPTNELRRQVQVYMPAPMDGW
jgi:hypothetical protein